MRVTLEGMIRMWAGSGHNIVLSEIIATDTIASGGNKGSLTTRVSEIFNESVLSWTIGTGLILKLGLFYSLVVVGFVKAIRHGNRQFAVVILVTALYFTIMTGALGDLRFRVPLIPLLSIVAGLGALTVWEGFRRFRSDSIPLRD
jgi:hypothetical protein